MRLRVVPAGELTTKTLRATDYVKSEAEKICEVYAKQGWYPAKWKHHPRGIKDALQQTGIRPKIKQCYANCQRLLTSGHPIAHDLEYHEGYVMVLIPVPHAWLVYGHAIVDLTLPPGHAQEYGPSLAYTHEEVCRSVATGYYGPVSEVALALLSPYTEHFKRMTREQLCQQVAQLLREGFTPERIKPLYEPLKIEIGDDVLLRAVQIRSEVEDAG